MDFASLAGFLQGLSTIAGTGYNAYQQYEAKGEAKKTREQTAELNQAAAAAQYQAALDKRNAFIQAANQWYTSNGMTPPTRAELAARTGGFSDADLVQMGRPTSLDVNKSTPIPEINWGGLAAGLGSGIAQAATTYGTMTDPLEQQRKNMVGNMTLALQYPELQNQAKLDAFGSLIDSGVQLTPEQQTMAAQYKTDPRQLLANSGFAALFPDKTILDKIRDQSISNNMTSDLYRNIGKTPEKK